MSAVGRLLRALLGCEWGRTVALPDDLEPCEDPVEGRYPLSGRYLRLCGYHGTVVSGQADVAAEADGERV